MRVRQVVGLACVISFLGNTVQAATPPADINDAITQINRDASLLSGWTGHQFAKAMPFNSTAGDVVPSQIKLLGFSVGASIVVSGSKVDTNALHNLGTTIVDTRQIDTSDRLPVPMVLGNVKFGLPFGLDAGVRLGGIPSTSSDDGDTHYDVTNKVFGLDLRKALIEEGLTRPFGLTLGVNYTHAKGHITAATTVDHVVAGSGITLNNAVSTARTEWNTDSVGAQVVINKKIAFINPYVGVAANNNFGDIDTSIANTGSITHVASAQTASLNGTGGSAHETISDWDMRGLFGIEFTLFPFMRLGIGGEVASENKVAGNLGLRFQFH